MDKSIVLISFPRSGSTYFCFLLEKIEQLKVYLEIFHFDEPVVSQHMFGDWEPIIERLVAEGVLPENYFLAYKQDPKPFLNELKKANPNKNVVYKVFPGHLSPDALRTCIQENVVLFLYRDILDAHISNEIAAKTGKYGNYDTTKEKVVFTSDGFKAFGRRVRNYFADARSLCASCNSSPILVTYGQATAEGFVGRIVPWLQESLDRQISQPDSETVTTMKRQDRRSLPEDKVSNPEEMNDALKAMGYERLAERDDLDQGVDRVIGYLDRLFGDKNA